MVLKWSAFETEFPMLNYQRPNLPFRAGDRVAIPYGEVGTIKSVEGQRVRIVLDDDEIISASASDVSLVAPVSSSEIRIGRQPPYPR